MKFLIWIASQILCIIVNGQEINSDHFTLNGHIDGRDTGLITLRYTSVTGELLNDTTYLKNGNFKFEGSIEEPTIATLTGKRKIVDFNSVNVVSIYLESGNMYVELKENNYSNSKVTGSKTQLENEELKLQQDSIKRKYKFYLDLLTRAKYKFQDAKTQNEKERALIEESEISPYLDSMKLEIFNANMAFLLSHPDSYVSPQFIYSAANKFLIDSVIALFRTLTPRIQNSKTGKYAGHYLKIKEQNTIGKRAYDFVARNIDGTITKLSDFKGKYVLLDFWASWCIPCIKLFPQTKALYKQYHPLGFEVAAISIDKDSLAWRNSVKQHQIDEWYQFLVNEDIRNNYPNVINPIPSAILIGPGSKIVWNSNEEKSLEEVLPAMMDK